MENALLSVLYSWRLVCSLTATEIVIEYLGHCGSLKACHPILKLCRRHPRKWLFAHNHLRDHWEAILRCALYRAILRATPRSRTRKTKANH